MAEQNMVDAVLEILRGEGSRTEQAERIVEMVEAEHHCRSCDMHSCGDLDRGPVRLGVWPIAELNPQTGRPWTAEEREAMRGEA